MIKDNKLYKMLVEKKFIIFVFRIPNNYTLRKNTLLTLFGEQSRPVPSTQTGIGQTQYKRRSFWKGHSLFSEQDMEQ